MLVFFTQLYCKHSTVFLMRKICSLSSSLLMGLHSHHFILCSCSACETEWELSPNTGTTGGTFVAAQTVDECRDLCVVDPECSAIDVSSGSPILCFLHTNESLGDGDSYTSEFISQHKLINKCPPGRCTERKKNTFAQKCVY